MYYKETSMNKELNDLLQQNVDEKYRKFQSGLCPGINNILGVRIPILRKIAKNMAKGDWEKIISEIDNKYYEETMVEGLIIGYAKMPISNKINYLKSFVPKIDNWAVCDIVCSNLKIKEKDLLWDFINTYLESKNEFELRFVVVMYMDNFLTDEYIKKVFENINKIKTDKYYVQMAIAWLISVAYVKQKAITEKYLLNNNLDVFTYNKALQKIIESNRVEKEEKEKIKRLKKLQK